VRDRRAGSTGAGGLSCGFKKPQIPPLRYAPVGMTIRLDNRKRRPSCYTAITSGDGLSSFSNSKKAMVDFAPLFRPRYAPTASRGRLANLGHPSISSTEVWVD
jgi:hypothetical protein